MVFYGKISVFMGDRMTQSEILFHGSLEVIEFPEIRTSRFHKDFYFGFYCTKLRPQAIRWAVRRSGRGILNQFRFMPNEMLRILRFDEMTDEWLDFIVACRLGQAHGFDIVEGPVADDTIFNYVQNFIEGEISREAFWALAKFRYPTHQISFHSARALASLSFAGYEEVNDGERP